MTPSHLRVSSRNHRQVLRVADLEEIAEAVFAGLFSLLFFLVTVVMVALAR